MITMQSTHFHGPSPRVSRDFIICTRQLALLMRCLHGEYLVAFDISPGPTSWQRVVRCSFDSADAAKAFQMPSYAEATRLHRQKKTPTPNRWRVYVNRRRVQVGRVAISGNTATIECDQPHGCTDGFCVATYDGSHVCRGTVKSDFGRKLTVTIDPDWTPYNTKGDSR